MCTAFTAIMLCRHQNKNGVWMTGMGDTLFTAMTCRAPAVLKKNTYIRALSKSYKVAAYFYIGRVGGDPNPEVLLSALSSLIPLMEHQTRIWKSKSCLEKRKWKWSKVGSCFNAGNLRGCLASKTHRSTCSRRQGRKWQSWVSFGSFSIFHFQSYTVESV